MKSVKFLSIAVVIYLVLYGMQNAYPQEEDSILKPYALRSGTHIQGDRWKERETEYFTSYSKCLQAAGEWVSGLKKGTPYWFGCNYHD